MSAPHRGPVVFLGPQRRNPNVRAVLSEFVADTDARPIALVTSGWEEREAEDQELQQHLDRPTHNLSLHQRALSVFDHDAELLTKVQAMHDELTELQRLYRSQLRHLLAAMRDLLAREGNHELLAEHRATAIENLRNLDQHHVEHTQRIRTRARDELEVATRPILAPHRAEIADALQDTSALCIAGGHVGVLYNRLWLFDVLDLVPADLPILAWSAGAMVLSRQIVLFHDDPPEGRGRAEVLGPGFNLVDGILPFPHAKHRLKLEDSLRVQLIAQRFGDCTCLAMNDGARLDWDGTTAAATGSAQTLETTGTVTGGN